MTLPLTDLLLPSHNHGAEPLENIKAYRFREIVGLLKRRIDRVNCDFFTVDVTPEEVIFAVDMFGPGTELVCFAAICKAPLLSSKTLQCTWA